MINQRNNKEGVFTLPVKKATEASPNTLLRKARQERGWSQKELADLIGAPHSFMISRWENGTAYPGSGYRKKLSSVFGKSCEELGMYKSVLLPVLQLAPTPISDPAIPVRQLGTSTVIGRSQILEQITQYICSRENDIFVGINGLPGIGKTTLAIELARAARIQNHFQHGVLWATLGPRPDLCAHLRRWSRVLNIKDTTCASLNDKADWTQALSQALESRRMLFILDDVWNIEDALSCVVGGSSCAYLLTTRVPAVATRFAGNQAIQIPELSLDEGLQLLGQIVPALLEKEWDVIFQLVQTAGGLPLTLTLMGNYLLVQVRHQQQRRIQEALKHLQQPKERMQLTQLQLTLDHTHRQSLVKSLSMQTIIGKSEILLDKASCHALYALSAFPTKPAMFSEEVALAVTTISKDTLDQLVDAGLIECNEENYYLLHQSIADYARCREIYSS